MRVQELGEKAWIISELGDQPAHVLANALRALDIPGIVDVVASYETLGIYTEFSSLDRATILQLLKEATQAPSLPAKRHNIPVCYDYGLDLAEVSVEIGISTEEIIKLHTSLVYRCFAIGFCPGFPYLGYLPEPLAKLGRRASPRTRIEPGSVAIAKGQTGIYPIPRPGGWHLIGQTPLTIVDIGDDYFPISHGDEVQFVRIDEAEYQKLNGERL